MSNFALNVKITTSWCWDTADGPTGVFKLEENHQVHRDTAVKPQSASNMQIETMSAKHTTTEY